MVATLRGAHAWVRLLRWLGPWADDRAPVGVTREEVNTTRDGRPVRMWVYRPGGRVRGACVLALGLHFLGPTHARAERLARVLAHAGYVVFVPFVPDYMALRLRPSAIDDFLAAARVALDHPACPGGRAGLMSISFGSLLALRAASAPDLADRFHGVLLFGGFADVRGTLDFAMNGVVDGERLADDLGCNLPVVFVQLLEHLPGPPGDRTPLYEAFMAYMAVAWEDPAVRYDRARQRALAHQLAASLDPALRDLFLLGCDAQEGGLALAESLLPHLETEHLDPRPFMANLRAPLFVVHGRGDTVIPYTEAAQIRAAAPTQVPCEVFLTGLFGHTAGAAGPGMAGKVAREVRTLARMAWSLAHLGVPRAADRVGAAAGHPARREVAS